MTRSLFSSICVLLVALVIVAVPVQAAVPTPTWQYRHHEESGGVEYGSAVAVDSQGNVIVAWQRGLAGRVYLSKYSRTGDKLWTREVPGSGIFHAPPSVGVDAFGRIAVLIVPYGWDPEVFLFTPDGQTVLWHQTIQDLYFVGAGYAPVMAVDSAGNVFVAGMVYGSGPVTIQALSGNNGASLWRQSLEGFSYPGVGGLAVAGSNVVVATGTVLHAYDSTSGTRRWSVSYEGPDIPGAYGSSTLAATPDGNVVLAGYSSGGLWFAVFGPDGTKLKELTNRGGLAVGSYPHLVALSTYPQGFVVAGRRNEDYSLFLGWFNANTGNDLVVSPEGLDDIGGIGGSLTGEVAVVGSIAGDAITQWHDPGSESPRWWAREPDMAADTRASGVGLDDRGQAVVGAERYPEADFLLFRVAQGGSLISKTEFPQLRLPWRMAVASDGRVAVTTAGPTASLSLLSSDDRALWQVDVSEFTEIGAPAFNSAGHIAIAARLAGADGIYVVYYDSQGNELKRFPVPVPDSVGSSFMLGPFAVGPDDRVAVWVETWSSYSDWTHHMVVLEGDGTPAWSVTLPLQDGDEPAEIAFDANGNLIVLNHSYATGSFGIFKLAANDGRTLWEKRYSPANGVVGIPSLAIAPDGTIAVAGSATDIPLILSTGAPHGPSIVNRDSRMVTGMRSRLPLALGTQALSGALSGTVPNVDIFIAGFGPEGDLLWESRTDLSTFDLVSDVAFGSEGYLVVSGAVFDGQTFDAAVVGYTLGDAEENRPPVASFSYSPTAGLTTDTEVVFRDESFDPDGRVVAWHWDFGDGTTADTQHPTHRYSAPGVYHVSLTVTDDDGAKSDPARRVVAVGSPDAPIERVQSYETQPGEHTIDATDVAGVTLVKRGPGTPVLTVAAYGGNPRPTEQPLFVGEAHFFDINVDSAQGVDSLSLTWAIPPGIPTERAAVLWYDPGVQMWRRVEPQQVDAQAGTVVLELSSTSSPSIAQLTGTVFGGGTSNTPPVANLGPDRFAAVGSPTAISGAASFDPDPGDRVVAYRWTLLSKPEGSQVTVPEVTSEPVLSFAPDRKGAYRLQLVVEDSYGWRSEPDEVRLEAVDVYAAPNPARQYVTFYYAPELVGGAVRLYDVAGRPVVNLPLGASGSFTWTLTDANGRAVASGLYLYMVFDKDGRPVTPAPLRLVVQR